MGSFRTLFALALLPALLGAQTATISVDATSSVRTVDERLFGVNATMWDPYASSDTTISLLDAIGLRAIRLPGGSQSNEYHWRTNTQGQNTWHWQTGFDGFAKIITGLDAQAFISVNYGTGTPEEAAAWVAYCNSGTTASGAVPVTIGTDAKSYDWKNSTFWADLRASTPLAQDDGMNFLRIGRSAPLNIRNWEIGNENYGTWEVDERPADQKWDAFTYATRAKDYLAKMRAVDPSIKIGVVALQSNTDGANGHTSHPATNPRTGAVYTGWTPVLLATLHSLGVTPDSLIYHRYEQAPAADRPGDPENDAKLLQMAGTWSNDAAAFRQMLTDYLGATEGAKVELVVTENNSVYGKPGKQTTSLVNALYYADSLGHVMQTEFNALTWWALRNSQDKGNNISSTLYGWRDYGDYGILASPSDASNEAGFYQPYPTYYGFKQVANFARGGDTVLSASSNNTLLTAFATRRPGGAVSVLVINKDPANAITGTLNFTGFVPQTVAKAFAYGKPQDDAARTGSGSQDVAVYDLGVDNRSFTAAFPSYSITVLTFEAQSAPVAAFAHISASDVNDGASATLTATSSASGTPTYQWSLNGTSLGGAASSSLNLSSVHPADSGLYQATVASGSNSASSEPTILGLKTSAKVIGNGSEVSTNVIHPNGRTFDQILPDGTALSVTADAGQATRTSFIDSNDDIVQVEFSGAGTLSIVFADASAPAAPTKYTQPTVAYMKGRAGIVIAGADETTNVSVFTVGRATAFDPTGHYNILLAASETNNPATNGSSLFQGHESTVYDGVADLAFIAISSTNGKFGGVRASNTRFSATKGVAGVYAPGVQFQGPLFIGDLDASGTATPMIVIGSSSDARITGGDLQQTNGQPVQVGGLTQLKFTAGGDSHGNALPAQTNHAVLERNGIDVTAQIVAP